MTEEKQIFTLKQVVNSIQKTISERYSSKYWIKAEINKLNLSYKGHCYPEIVQKENDKIIAEMKGIIWGQQYEMISKKFSEIVKEPLRDGINVLFLAKIVFHPLFGLSLEISDIDASFSLGEIEKEKRETLLKLKKNGILNKNQLLNFPILPKRLAIISNKSGDGYKDFINKILKNQWFYSFNFTLFESQLSGDFAVTSIINQMDKIEKDINNFDVVLIIRGGGSEVGMSCYNNYKLCEKICLFPIPVLTGIGHASNTTVAEMVCYQSAITPSELAENLLSKFRELDLELMNLTQNISSKSREFISYQRQISLQFQIKLAQLTNKIIQFSKLNISESEQKLISNSEKFIKQENNTINSLFKDIKNLTGNELEKNKNKLSSIFESLPNFIENYLKFKSINLMRIEDTIQLSDPINILKKGYSISYYKDKIIKPETKFDIGGILTTITENKVIKSKIETIKNNN